MAVVSSGVGTIIKLGGGAGAPPPENYLPPNSSFSSDFGHFILKMPFSNENKISKIFKVHFSVKVGGIAPPPLSKLEGQLPPLPHLFLRLWLLVQAVILPYCLNYYRWMSKVS